MDQNHHHNGHQPMNHNYQNHPPIWNANYQQNANPHYYHNVYDNYNFMYEAPTFPTPPNSHGSARSDPNSPIGFKAPRPMDHYDPNWMNPNFHYSNQPTQGSSQGAHWHWTAPQYGEWESGGTNGAMNMYDDKAATERMNMHVGVVVSAGGATNAGMNMQAGRASNGVVPVGGATDPGMNMYAGVARDEAANMYFEGAGGEAGGEENMPADERMNGWMNFEGSPNFGMNMHHGGATNAEMSMYSDGTTSGATNLPAERATNGGMNMHAGGFTNREMHASEGTSGRMGIPSGGATHPAMNMHAGGTTNQEMNTNRAKNGGMNLPSEETTHSGMNMHAGGAHGRMSLHDGSATSKGMNMNGGGAPHSSGAANGRPFNQTRITTNEEMNTPFGDATNSGIHTSSGRPATLGIDTHTAGEAPMKNQTPAVRNEVKKPRTIAEAHFQNLEKRKYNVVVPGENQHVSMSVPAPLGHDPHPPTLQPELPPPPADPHYVVTSSGKIRKRPAPTIPKKPRECPTNSDVHFHKKQYMCKWDKCRERFRHRTDYLNHIDQHIDDKDAKEGNMCLWNRCARDDKFRFTYQLRNHLRIHTGEKPFVCKMEECTKEFARPESLRAHYLAHAGLKPYACAHCDMRYYFVTDINRHMKKKHPEVEYTPAHTLPDHQPAIPQTDVNDEMPNIVNDNTVVQNNVGLAAEVPSHADPNNADPNNAVSSHDVRSNVKPHHEVPSHSDPHHAVPIHPDPHHPGSHHEVLNHPGPRHENLIHPGPHHSGSHFEVPHHPGPDNAGLNHFGPHHMAPTDAILRNEFHPSWHHQQHHHHLNFPNNFNHMNAPYQF